MCSEKPFIARDHKPFLTKLSTWFGLSRYFVQVKHLVNLHTAMRPLTRNALRLWVLCVSHLSNLHPWEYDQLETI